MKIRYDFVTNSSSSSFIINKRHLDADQIEAIRRHDEIGAALGLHYAEERWCIEENNGWIGAHTSMDNFDMMEFLERIDVNMRHVNWSDPIHFQLPSDTNWRDLL